MTILSDRPDPRAIEREARSLWASQHLPPAHGLIGPEEGPLVHQFLGSFAPQEAGMLAVQRVIAADVDARAMALAGRRVKGILRREEGGPPTPVPRMDPLLASLGAWVGGEDGKAWDDAPRRQEVQTLVGVLAHLGALAVRDVSLRICPACATARSPERIVYREEEGATLLVRFPFVVGDRTVSALVWTDAAWRLLGTSALMVHPELPYVIARYRRREVEELVFTSKSSLDRIRGWLPGATFEVLEEHPGRHWEGQPYVHPLRHEFPMGGSMEPPGGTILSVAEVGDSGTGVVPLVPGHGGTDTQIADRLQVPGWPLVTPKGRFDILYVHMYAGLELESGNEFVARDLAEEGAIFARLRVRRGVPHCVRCGTALIWVPGRAWCLEPSRLPEEKVAIYRSLLPRDRPIEKLEAVPWPVSEPQRSDDPQAIALLECTSCDRLEALGEENERCPCGGHRRPVRRRLLTGFDTAVAAWASVDPFPAADSAHLYVNERRRAPAVVHHIAAMSGVAGTVGEVRLTILPTVPEVDLPQLISTQGADTVRAALVRAQSSEGATATFAERCAQERRRLDSFWRTAREILAQLDGPSLTEFAQPIGGTLGTLEPEDRALLARFERLRIQCLVDFDRSAPGLVHRRLFQFLENDLVRYREWVAPRLALEGSPPSKRAALHTLVHVLSGTTLLLGPIQPHTAEVVHRFLRRGRASLFEEPAVGVDRALLDDARVRAWGQWESVVRAVDRFRYQIRLPPHQLLPSIVLVVDSDMVADQFRAEASTLERLARVQKVEVGSPGAPWTGRRRQLRPRESEIQRVYASRAAQIIHLLRRMPERKWADPASGQEFSLIVNGEPTRILPSMISWVETLPERVVPVPWPEGELYVEVPLAGGEVASPPPPLSSDAFALVARIARRIRSAATTGPRAAIVAAPNALAAELAGVADAIAKYLGVEEFRVVTSDRELPRHHLERGRTKAGSAWAFHVVGVSPPVRPSKNRPVRGHGARVRPAFSPADLVPTVRNYADGEVVSREAAVRALGEELDGILGAPLLGPAKISTAWEAGLQSVDAFRRAPWETLVALPGFGPPIATALLTKLGGTVPPPSPRPARRAAWAAAAEGISGVGGGAVSSVLAGVRALSTASPPGPPRVETSALPALREVSIPNALPPSAPSVAADRPVEAAPPEPTPATVPEASLPEEVPSVPALPAPPSEVEELPAPGVPALPRPTGESNAETSPSEAAAESGAPTGELLAPPPVEPPLEGPAVPGPAFPEPESAPVGTLEIVPDESAPPLETPLGEAPAAEEATTGPETGPSVPPPRELPGVVPAPAPMEGEPTYPQEPPERAEEGADQPPTQDFATASPALEPTGQGELPETSLTGPIDEELPWPSEEPAPVPRSPEEGRALPATLDEVAPSAPEPPAEAPMATSGPAEEGLAPSGLPQTPLPPALETPKAPAPGPPLETVPESPTIPTNETELSTPKPTLALPSVASPGDLSQVPVSLPSPVSPPTPTGGIDLAVGPTYFPPLERFLEATAAGHQGICVVRDSPERVRAYVGSRPVEIRWLTNIGRGATLKPSDLDGFAAFLAHAVTSAHVTAFFLEGMEYLIRLHGLDRVVERMLEFDAVAREHSARVWVPLNPKLLSPTELDRFVVAFGNRADLP